MKIFSKLVFCCSFLVNTIAIQPAHSQTLLDGSFPNGSGVSFADLHRRVGATLLDPRSAQYRGLLLVRSSDGGKVICGWVNARNSMGGYTQFVPFYYDLKYGAQVLDQFNTSSALRQLGLEMLRIKGCGGLM
jgi:hypothetical protein